MSDELIEKLAIAGGIAIVLMLIATFSVAFWILFRAFVVTNLAKRNWLFTFRREGHIKYLMIGELLVEYIYKIQGHYIDRTNDIVTPDDQVWDRAQEKFVPSLKPTARNPERTWSEWIFGAYWIGFPPRTIKRYPIYYVREMRPGEEDKSLDNGKNTYRVDKKHNMVERYTWTDYQPYRQNYSIYVPKIEVKGFMTEHAGKQVQGQAQVDIWGTFTVLAFNARTPVLELEGNWFTLLRDGISGAAADYLSSKDLESVRAIKKVQPRIDKATKRPMPTRFEQAILNVSVGPSGTGTSTGLIIDTFNAAGIEVEDKTEEVLRKRGIAQIVADTREIRGKGVGAYERERGKGIADADAAQVNAIGTNAVAAEVLKVRQRREGMKDLKSGITFVEGSAQAPFISVGAPPVAVPQEDTEKKDSEETDQAAKTEPEMGPQPRPDPADKPNPTPKQTKKPQPQRVSVQRRTARRPGS